MIIILDTSVLIAFLLSAGTNNCRDIIRLAKDDRIQLASSLETIKELKRVISLSAIKKMREYNSRKIASFIAWYQYNMEYYLIEKKAISTIRDEKDRIFLDLAIASHANYIISGDKDLLVIKRIQKTKIITAKEFIISISKE